VRVFLNRRLRCIGCPIAPFHTLADAAREHGCDLEGLTTEIEAAARS
jgi:hybrid cluster-associated redox disulfide protein